MKATLALWGAVTVGVLFQGLAMAADAPGVKEDKRESQQALGVQQGSDQGKGGGSAKTPVLVNGVWMYTVSQTIEGHVAGRTVTFSEAGQLRPARVRIGFVQHGRIFSATASDESGRFLVKGVAPGVYTVIASGSEGIGVFWVRVTAHDQTAKSGEVLELPLAATGDAILLPGILSGKSGNEQKPIAKPAGNP
jgi:hypothetical protein